MRNSSKNFITIKEELAQYDIFKLIIENHEEHWKILKSEEQSSEEDRFEDIDQRMSIFKHKVRNWMKDDEDKYDKGSKSSGRSSKGRSSKVSTRLSRSSKTSSSGSSEANYLKSKVSSKLLKKLKIGGTATSISIKTLNEENTSFSRMKLIGS